MTKPLPYRLRQSTLLLALLLGACSAAPQKVPDDVPVWRQGVRFAEASHVGWTRSNDAFGKDFRWRIGDRVLYALTRYNQGNIERRFIELEVESLSPDLGEGEDWTHIFFFTGEDGTKKSLSSMNMHVRVTISDENGKEISSTLSDVPEAYLRLGFFRGCKAGVELRSHGKYREDTDGKLHLSAPAELYEALASLQALFSVLASSKSLRPILEEVVEKPPLLVLLPALISGGISISVAPDILGAKKTTIPDLTMGKWSSGEGVDPIPRSIEGYSFPITVSINDYPGLYARVLVAPPEQLAPLGGGIISVEGRHPRNKDIWLSMRLLGSKRSSAISQD